MSLLQIYFTTHIGLAIGIASSSSSLGGAIYSIVLSKFIGQVGFPWAVRAVGFIALGTITLPLFAMRMRIRALKPRSIIDWSAFTDAPYMVLTLGVSFVFIANTVAVFYISYYPPDHHLTNEMLGFYIVAIFNSGSVPGRILPNALSDRIGVFNTLVPLTLILGVTQFALLGVFNTAGVVVEAVATGLFSGVVIALPPVAFPYADREQGHDRHAHRHGFCACRIRLVSCRARHRCRSHSHHSPVELDRRVGLWWFSSIHI
jgi:hypothetical protein